MQERSTGRYENLIGQEIGVRMDAHVGAGYMRGTRGTEYWEYLTCLAIIHAHVQIRNMVLIWCVQVTVSHSLKPGGKR